MRPLRIHTVVWGDQYIDWMNRALVRSLSWPKNKAAIRNAKWTIWSDLEHTQKIYDIATKVLPFHQIELKQKIHDGKNPKGPANLLECMMQTMRMCLLEKGQLLTCPPDTIFADGTIQTMIDYADQDGSCVAVPHPRVLTSIMDHLTTNPISNAKLVTLGLVGHPHDAWTKSNRELNVGASEVGGISWQKTDDLTWAVQHQLPTIYLANFNDEDRKFFSRDYCGRNPQYGMWDHEWPGQNVLGPQPILNDDPKKTTLSNQRQRTIGSSDAAFIMEVTEPWRNVPTIKMQFRDEPDRFHRDEYHNRINRQYVSCFRGE